MPRVFISYRRDDSAYPAHAIYDRLTARFGAGSVVFDVDTIPLGIDFVEYLDHQVRQCDVLLALIGDSWATIAGPDGKRRLDNPKDFVRIEIAAALKRGIPVVPVLVGHASMPRSEQLPSNLKNLARRNAAELRAGRDFEAHLDRLVQGLDVVSKQVGSLPAESPADAEVVQLPEAGLVVDERTGIIFVRIPAGRFRMGSDYDHVSERPVHEVEITHDFLLGRCPITNAEYARFLEAVGSSAQRPKYWDDRRFNQPEQPVVGVSWDDARAFCQWARCRLPTEAEWEYACRAGTTTEYSFGDRVKLLGEYGSFAEDSNGQTQLVGAKKPNPWRLYDMHGNVCEWCQDWFSEKYYGQSPAADPPGPANGWARVFRGGCYLIHADYCRSAFRYGYSPEDRFSHLGFRVARSPSGK